MKVYITGTTRGLGKALLDQYERSEVFGEIVELNRPLYDITDPNVWIPTDFDVFINNAHAGYSQTDLLYKLFEANKDRDCMIINIGSVSADGDRKEINEYAIQKKALDAACTQLQLVKSTCRVIQIKLGHMDTEMIKHVQGPKMDTYELARHIRSFEEISWNYLVKSVTLDNKL